MWSAINLVFMSLDALQYPYHFWSRVGHCTALCDVPLSSFLPGHDVHQMAQNSKQSLTQR